MACADTNYKGAYYFCPQLNALQNQVGEVNKLAKSQVATNLVHSQEVPSLDIIRKAVEGKEAISLQSMMKIFNAISGIARSSLPQAPHYQTVAGSLQTHSIVAAWRYASRSDLVSVRQQLGFTDPAAFAQAIFAAEKRLPIAANIVWHNMEKGYSAGEFTYTEDLAKACYSGLTALAPKGSSALPAFDVLFKPDPAMAPRQGHSTRALGVSEGQIL